MDSMAKYAYQKAVRQGYRECKLSQLDTMVDPRSPKRGQKVGSDCHVDSSTHGKNVDLRKNLDAAAIKHVRSASNQTTWQRRLSCHTCVRYRPGTRLRDLVEDAVHDLNERFRRRAWTSSHILG